MELFDIVKLISTDKFINPIYEDNIDTLEKQIHVSENIISEIFKPFIEKPKRAKYQRKDSERCEFLHERDWKYKRN